MTTQRLHTSLYRLAATLSAAGCLPALVGCAGLDTTEIEAENPALAELDDEPLLADESAELVGEIPGDFEEQTPLASQPEELEFELAQTRQALRNDDPTDPTPPIISRCFDNLAGSLSASASRIDLGQSVTLRWRVTVPTGCSSMRFYLGNSPVAASGSSVVQPIANSTYSLRAVVSGGQATVGSARVEVTLPLNVTINANNQAPLLAQALATAGTQVTVQNHVQMDVSSRTFNIAAGVSLRGGRTPRDPGPRLYSTAPLGTLLNVSGDNVRISGLRLEGPDMGVPDGDTPACIRNDSFVELEIDNNEIYGWTGSAISISDNDEFEGGNRIDYALNPATIRVHDNYIHHNQHIGRFGYGVVVGDGAYVLIQRNVFDWNRHAIAGDGSDGSGFRAIENLVLKNGGLHRWILGAWVHTHQFDMHGQDNCGVWDLFSDSLYNCGTAGHDMTIRYNTFLYTEDNAFKLRGTPQLQPVGAFVGNNVFAHDSFDDAVSQTESGLRDEGTNRFGIDGSARLGSCDLDGDGATDSFMATGQTWWYSARGTMPWSYLHTSTKLLSEVLLGDFNGDARCDVLADGVVYPGGRPAPRFGIVTGVLQGAIQGVFSAQ